MSNHKCDYGCLAAERKDEKCIYCGHPRSHHSPAHPHVCLGAKLSNDGTSMLKPCESVCGGFTLTNVYAIVEVNPDAIDDFKPLEELGGT